MKENSKLNDNMAVFKRNFQMHDPKIQRMVDTIWNHTIGLSTAEYLFIYLHVSSNNTVNADKLRRIAHILQYLDPCIRNIVRTNVSNIIKSMSDKSKSDYLTIQRVLLTNIGKYRSRVFENLHIDPIISKTVVWCKINYTVAENSSITKLGVYSNYLIFCKHIGISPLSATVFASIMYIIFSDILQSKGTRTIYYQKLTLQANATSPNLFNSSLSSIEANMDIVASSLTCDQLNCLIFNQQRTLKKTNNPIIPKPPIPDLQALHSSNDDNESYTSHNYKKCSRPSMNSVIPIVQSRSIVYFNGGTLYRPANPITKPIQSVLKDNIFIPKVVSMQGCDVSEKPKISIGKDFESSTVGMVRSTSVVSSISQECVILSNLRINPFSTRTSSHQLTAPRKSECSCSYSYSVPKVSETEKFLSPDFKRDNKIEPLKHIATKSSITKPSPSVPKDNICIPKSFSMQANDINEKPKIFVGKNFESSTVRTVTPSAAMSRISQECVILSNIRINPPCTTTCSHQLTAPRDSIRCSVPRVSETEALLSPNFKRDYKLEPQTKSSITKPIQSVPKYNFSIPNSVSMQGYDVSENPQISIGKDFKSSALGLVTSSSAESNVLRKSVILSNIRIAPPINTSTVAHQHPTPIKSIKKHKREHRKHIATKSTERNVTNFPIGETVTKILNDLPIKELDYFKSLVDNFQSSIQRVYNTRTDQAAKRVADIDPVDVLNSTEVCNGYSNTVNDLNMQVEKYDPGYSRKEVVPESTKVPVIVKRDESQVTLKRKRMNCRSESTEKPIVEDSSDMSTHQDSETEKILLCSSCLKNLIITKTGKISWENVSKDE